MDRTRICVRSSIPLESAEKSLLNAVLPRDAASYADAKPEIPIPASDSPVTTHEGWQPLATIEIGSLFVVGIATLSILFLKSLAEEGGKRFWDAIVALHRRVAARSKAQRLGRTSPAYVREEHQWRSGSDHDCSGRALQGQDSIGQSHPGIADGDA